MDIKKELTRSEDECRKLAINYVRSLYPDGPLCVCEEIVEVLFAKYNIFDAITADSELKGEKLYSMFIVMRQEWLAQTVMADSLRRANSKLMKSIKPGTKSLLSKLH